MRLLRVENRRQPDKTYVYVPYITRESKYMPHIGKKRGGKGKVFHPLYKEMLDAFLNELTPI